MTIRTNAILGSRGGFNPGSLYTDAARTDLGDGVRRNHEPAGGRTSWGHPDRPADGDEHQPDRADQEHRPLRLFKTGVSARSNDLFCDGS